jgi:hypothetical protein
MVFLKPLVELLVSPKETFEGFTDDVLVRRATKESRIALKHGVSFLVETCGDYFLFLLGFDLRNQSHILFSSGGSASKLPTASLITLPATERGDLLDNLGGSDPRRPWRWAAAKPLKVGSLPPKILLSSRPIPMLRRRLSPSFFGTSNCGQRKSGRKSKPIVASEQPFVPEAPFCCVLVVIRCSFNLFEFMALRLSDSGNLDGSAAGNLR